MGVVADGVLGGALKPGSALGVVISIALGTSMNGEFLIPAQIKNITTLGAGVADPVEGLAIFIS